MVIPREIFYLIFFICGGGMVFCSLWLGFRLGRMSVGAVEPSKPIDPGNTNPPEEDPYREAFPGQEVERIPTIKEEGK